MQHESMLSLLALYCLLSSLFLTETLSSFYLESAVFLSGSQCNDLSLPARTEESLRFFHVGCSLSSLCLTPLFCNIPHGGICRIFSNWPHCHKGDELCQVSTEIHLLLSSWHNILVSRWTLNVGLLETKKSTRKCIALFIWLTPE